MTQSLDERIAELERTIHMSYIDERCAGAARSAGLEAIALLREVAKDSERYRWLRENIRWILDDEAGLSGVAFSHQLSMSVIRESDDASLLDAVADAAISANKEPEYLSMSMFATRADYEAAVKLQLPDVKESKP